jgi:hypothetical protein
MYTLVIGEKTDVKLVLIRVNDAQKWTYVC